MDSYDESKGPRPEESMSTEGSQKRHQNQLFIEQESHAAKRLKRQPFSAANDGDASFPIVISTMDDKMLNSQGAMVEGRPAFAFYHPGFDQAQDLVTTICDDFHALVQQLRDEGYCNKEIDHVCERSLLFIREPEASYPEVKPVVLLGPAGVGKSATLNCLLGQEAMAIESGSITRGTHIVHQYAKAKKDQWSKYLVEVSYHAEKFIKSQVKSHVNTIVDFLFGGDEQEEWDIEERKEMYKRKDTAISFFVTTLCDREDFETKDAVTRYFKNQAKRNRDEVFSMVYKQIAEVLESEQIIPGEGVKYIPAYSVEELHGVLRGISGPLETSEFLAPSIWPFIRLVTIHLDHDLLKAGVILADTPGVSDSNRDIVESTKDYLSGAGTILVFATPKRIASSEELDGLLRDCIALGKIGNVSLCVTMIDEKCTVKDLDRRQFTAKDHQLLLEAERRVLQVDQETHETSNALQEAMDVKHMKDLMKKSECLRVEKIKAENGVKQACIQIRNRIIKAALNDKLRELSGDDGAPDLEVLCLSNTEYQRHVAGYSITNLPILEIEATGIPTLRRKLYGIPAHGKYDTLSAIALRRLPNILDGISGILNRPRLERKEEVECLISKVLEAHTAVVRPAIDHLSKAFGDHITKTTWQYEAEWTEKAVGLLDEWAKLWHSTFSAFCRRCGIWKLPKSKEKVNWNQKLAAVSARKLMVQFNLLNQDIEARMRRMVDELMAVYRTLKTELEACSAFQGVDEGPFFKFIDGVANKVLEEVTEHSIKALQQPLAQIRYAATIAHDSHSQAGESYMSLLMRDTYKECLEANATVGPNGKKTQVSGAHELRASTIRKRLAGRNGPGIFVDINNHMTERFEEIVMKWSEGCVDRIAMDEQEIKRDFHRRFDVEEVKEENEVALEKLQEAVQQARVRIDGELKEYLLRAKEYEDNGRLANQ